MITLKTLPQATAQEVFDQVAAHLMAQGQRSIEPTEHDCQYRGNNDLKCAAGCLIADDEYDAAKFEGTRWCGLLDEGVVPQEHNELIEQLQDVHDHKDPDDWHDALVGVGAEHNLKLDVLVTEEDE